MTPRRRVQVAIALWIAFAFVAWNALFDYLVIRAGRDFLHASAIANHAGRPPLFIAEWMRPAVKRAALSASILGFAILACGMTAVFFARQKGKHHQGPTKQAPSTSIPM